MRHKFVGLTDKSLDLYIFSNFGSYNTNSRDISKMKKILQRAIDNELTDKQRFCVYEYYYCGKSMKSIAEDMKVNPSTVSRHIQNAERRLKRVAKYY